MSTVQVIRTLSGSPISSQSSFSSLRCRNSNFAVTDTCKYTAATDTRKCSALPPTKPKVNRGGQKVFSRLSKEEVLQLLKCCPEEAPQGQADSSVESIPDANLSAHGTSLRGFRPDLQEQVQKSSIKQYREERHAAWVKNFKVSKWTRHEQIMSLSLVVVEAHIQMRKLRAVRCTPVPPRDPVFAPLPKPTQLDVTCAETVTMILNDILLLLEDNKQQQEIPHYYEFVRAQIHGLRLWKQ